MLKLCFSAYILMLLAAYEVLNTEILRVYLYFCMLLFMLGGSFEVLIRFSDQSFLSKLNTLLSFGVQLHTLLEFYCVMASSIEFL